MPTDIDPPYLLLLCASLAALLYCVYRFFYRWRETRLLEDTPLAPLRSAAQGYVKTAGQVQGVSGTALRAPLSGRACVWWSYTVDEREEHWYGRSRWTRTAQGTSEECFLLKDLDSQCQVDPQQAEVEPSENNVWVCNPQEYGPAMLTPCGPVRAALARFGILAWRRYQESLILDNAQVSVLGELKSYAGDASNAIDDEAAVLLGEWKHDQQSLLARFDKDHDGRLNESEWESVRAAAVNQVQHNRLHDRPSARVSTIQMPSDGRPFVIAALSAANLAQREQRRAIRELVLVALALVACCYALSHLHTA